jgi:hypothetical protein
MLNPSSKYLSERLISRLSPLRRANLGRRVSDHILDAKAGRDARGNVTHGGPTPHLRRCIRTLGRLAALTA